MIDQKALHEQMMAFTTQVNKPSIEMKLPVVNFTQNKKISSQLSHLEYYQLMKEKYKTR